MGFQQIHFEFNCGGETGSVTSKQKYNSAEWHDVTLVRNAGHGKLSVDSDRIGEVSVTCIDPATLTPPYYYGGLRHVTDAKNLQVRLLSVLEDFVGCNTCFNTYNLYCLIYCPGFLQAFRRLPERTKDERAIRHRGAESGQRITLYR